MNCKTIYKTMCLLNVSSFYISDLEHSILFGWIYFSCFSFPNYLFPCSVMKTPRFLYSIVQGFFFFTSNPIKSSTDWTSGATIFWFKCCSVIGGKHLLNFNRIKNVHGPVEIQGITVSWGSINSATFTT